MNERLLAHAYVGTLWQPPTYDAPTAARVLGVVPPGAPVPNDLRAELDLYAEAGLVAQPVPQLRLAVTPWVRFSRHTIDDNEVGDTALTADYNYDHGRAVGFEVGAVWALWQRLHGFANATFELSRGAGIASARYLFTPEQLAFTGYQATDNAQTVSANAGLDLADQAGTTHLAGLVTFGSGLRTGPTNNATLPASTVVDVTLAPPLRRPAAARAGDRRAEPFRRRLRLPDRDRQPGRHRVRIAARGRPAAHDPLGGAVSGRRLLPALGLAAFTAVAAIRGCGFGRADDSGKPIPGQYWGWACPDGGAPDGSDGCSVPDASTADGNDASGVPGDGAASDR